MVKWNWPTDQADMLTVVERKLIKLRSKGRSNRWQERGDRRADQPAGTGSSCGLVRHVEATRKEIYRALTLVSAFEVRNDNFFPVKISTLTVSVNVEGVEMANDQVLTTGERAGPTRRDPRASLTMDSETHPKTLRQLLRRGNLAYTVKGTVFHGSNSRRYSCRNPLSGVVGHPYAAGCCWTNASTDPPQAGRPLEVRVPLWCRQLSKRFLTYLPRSWCAYCRGSAGSWSRR